MGVTAAAGVVRAHGSSLGLCCCLRCGCGLWLAVEFSATNGAAVVVQQRSLAGCARMGEQGSAVAAAPTHDGKLT